VYVLRYAAADRLKTNLSVMGATSGWASSQIDSVGYIRVQRGAYPCSERAITGHGRFLVTDVKSIGSHRSEHLKAPLQNFPH